MLTTSANFGNEKEAGSFNIGWASADITPEEPAPIAGSSVARISQDVMDPISATIFIMESLRDSGTAEMTVMVSIDLCIFSNELLESVRDMVKQAVPEIDVSKILINTTHTHDAPETRTGPDLAAKFSEYGIEIPMEWSEWGIDLGVMSPVEYTEFAAGRITGAIRQAWNERKPGGISFGLAHAVIGHNRVATYYDGSSEMYARPRGINNPDFSHIEGYEDHSLNLIYTWNSDRKLTGVLINTAIPSQAGGSGGRISADYWYETRRELRARLGEGLFIYTQCSAGGDQSPSILVGSQAEARMQQITGRNRREQIAVRIADAVTSILPYMENNIDWNPVLGHRVEQVELSRRRLTREDISTPRRTWHHSEVLSVEETFEQLLAEYKKMLKEIEEQPELRQEPGWYRPITRVFWLLSRASRVLDRYELQYSESTMPFEIHVIRVGDIAIATNPFELYLDFGMQMKARSKAIQTFVVQLTGGYANYLPTHRAVEGGTYGAIPESNDIGPEGGRELVERTIELIDSLWEN